MSDVEVLLRLSLVRAELLAIARDSTNRLLRVLAANTAAVLARIGKER